MKKLLLLPISLLLFAFMNISVPAMVNAATAPATACPSTTNPVFPSWYKYLDLDKNCDVVIADKELPKNIILIGLAIIEMLLVLAGILAVVMVTVGGFKYVISMAEPDKLTEAKQTIKNALVGVVVAIIASQVVTFIASSFSDNPNANYGLPTTAIDSGNIQDLLNIFLVVVGAVSVFMIVLSGVKIMSAGANPQTIAKWRNTIFFALVGLIITIFAAVIVNFVLGIVI